MRIPDPDTKTLIKIHSVAMILWPILLIPTVLWWKDLVLWVAFLSLYANFVGHFSAWDAARAAQDKKLAIIHFCGMVTWAFLLIPTITWWSESILWLAIMSIYANTVGHASGIGAARAEQNDKEPQSK